MLEGLEQGPAPGDDPHLGGSEPPPPGPGAERPGDHRPPRTRTDLGPGPGRAYVEVNGRREPCKALLHSLKDPLRARRARVPDPLPSVGAFPNRSATSGPAGPERSHLDRVGELSCEPTVGTERREQVKDVRTVEGPEPCEGGPELLDLPPGAGLPEAGRDRARGHSAFSEPLPGLPGAREGAGELLEAHVHRAVRSVRPLDLSGLHAPGTPPAESAGPVRRGAHSPRRGDREGRRPPGSKAVGPSEPRPLPRAVDRPRERTAPRAEQMHRVAGRREPTARSQDLLDIPEASADDGREQVDVDPGTPTARFSRPDGRA